MKLPRCTRRVLLMLLLSLGLLLVVLLSSSMRNASLKHQPQQGLMLYDTVNRNVTNSLYSDFLAHIVDRRKSFVTAPLRSIYGWEESYFQKLHTETQVEIYKLEGNFDVIKKLYYSQYYRWTASKLVCERIQQFTDAETDLLFMNSVCHNELDKAFEVVKFNILFVDSGPPFNLKGKHTQMSSGDVLVTYMHFIRHGVVLAGGNVQSGDVIISPRACTPSVEDEQEGIKTKAMSADEVFVISQYWAENYFHSLMETLPRLAPYIDFLRQNPAIKIHSEPTLYITRALEMLDISPRRIISGNVRAKMIYLPEGVRCAHAQIYNTQLLAQTFIQHMESLYPRDRRNVIILIKRSAKRFFRKHLSILGSLKTLAQETHNEVIVFDDRDLPKFSKTVRLFHRARMVVGIHGAGLSNIMFSQPGTFVIEALCFQPRAILCYRRLAHILGHHYHAVASKESCLDVTSGDIIPSARYFLTHNE